MNANELRARTKQFTLRVMKVVESLPNTIRGRNVANQLMRAGSSVGANDRAVCRSRSDNDFINKIGVVLEEADESAFWLEIVSDSGLLSPRRIAPLLGEANELVAIMAASRNTAIRRSRNSKAKSRRKDSAI